MNIFKCSATPGSVSGCDVRGTDYLLPPEPGARHPNSMALRMEHGLRALVFGELAMDPASFAFARIRLDSESTIRSLALQEIPSKWKFTKEFTTITIKQFRLH